MTALTEYIDAWVAGDADRIARAVADAVRKIDDVQSFAKDHARGIQSVSALDDVSGQCYRS